jgi:SprT-like family
LRRFEKLVSVAASLTILGGASYASQREKLRQTDLHEVYQQINRKHFDGQLGDCAVVWSYLNERLGEITFDDYGCEIRIDRYENRNLAQTQQTLFHESCHRFVGLVPEADVHGKQFTECMRRFDL